ncbi:hypothetical protein DDE74_29870 [Streptomyces lydicus]|uniref:Uncharacterized protein n=1 Tax=Streptomyces lydicus TaxID=47763 RepID=A0A3Q9K8N7_9ACTN|nr:hypothetical protein DDE74_29870 [Streptomyces lydicus]
MSADRKSRCRIAIVDDDPLRARREARELLSEITETDPEAALDLRQQSTVRDTDKGGLSVDGIGVLISAGSLIASGVQIWLAKVPQRTIVVTRPDGASLSISGRQAREDDERVRRFLSGDDGEENQPDTGTGTHGDAESDGTAG